MRTDLSWVGVGKLKASDLYAFSPLSDAKFLLHHNLHSVDWRGGGWLEFG